MQFSVSLSTIFNCSLERAFKTPMLCDVTKVHTGLGLMPKIIAVQDEQNWGQVGGSKKVIAAKSISFKGGVASTDHVLERVENKKWVIEVNDFTAWMLGFYSFIGTWETTEIEPGKIRIDYNYVLRSNQPIFYPLAWMFARLFWKRYMHQVMDNIEKLIENEEPYMYA